MVRLETKLKFDESGVLPACLPKCQSECKTKWEDLTVKKMQDETMAVLNAKYDVTDNTLKKYELELRSQTICADEFPSRFMRLVKCI